MENFLWKLSFLGLFVLYLMATPLHASSGDNDNDGIFDSLENQIMDKYAPQLILHPDEDYAISSVNWYLERVAMRFHHRGCLDEQILNSGDVNQSSLLLQQNYLKGNFCIDNNTIVYSTDARDTYKDGGFFLQPSNENEFDQLVYKGDSNQANWRIYAHIQQSTTLNNGYDIQYWFFYPFNEAPSVAGVKLNHEGDWEHITVTVDNSLNFHNAYYASHNDEGKRYSASELTFANPNGIYAASNEKLTGNFTHPVIYSAKGTHASYPTAGSQDRGILPTDYTGNGQVWNSVTKVINVGEKEAPLNGQTFIRYGGLWGEIGNTSISTGPKGPAFQSAWFNE